MADIRINALPTTASASSSDDYIALDGTTNGTRKLNAYSPTFGGNLTVSGTATSNAVGASLNALGAGGQSGYLVSDGHLIDLYGGTSTHFVMKRAKNTSTQNRWGLFMVDGEVSPDSGTGSNLSFRYAVNNGAWTEGLKLDRTGNATLAGNLTVSGNVYGGSNLVLYGTTGATGNVYLRAQGAGYVRVDTGSGFRVESGSLDVTAGSLTVSGTGTSSFAGAVTIANTASTSSYQTGLRLQSSAGSAPNTIQALEFYSSTLSAALGAIDALREAGSFASSLRFYSTTSGGALTERGRFNSSGNLLIGTTTDSGNGKLQLATHTTSAGGIGFGTDTALYRMQNGVLGINGTSLGGVRFTSGSTIYGYAYANSTEFEAGAITGSCRFVSNNAIALTLDSSQNATFAGNYVYVGGGTSFYLRATGSGNGLWYGNNVSFDGNSFSFRNQAGTVTNQSFDSSKVFIANTQAVPATPTGGGHLYVEGGALKYKGSSGTVTTIANA